MCFSGGCEPSFPPLVLAGLSPLALWCSSLSTDDEYWDFDVVLWSWGSAVESFVCGSCALCGTSLVCLFGEDRYVTESGPEVFRHIDEVQKVGYGGGV